MKRGRSCNGWFKGTGLSQKSGCRNTIDPTASFDLVVLFVLFVLVVLVIVPSVDLGNWHAETDRYIIISWGTLVCLGGGRSGRGRGILGGVV